MTDADRILPAIRKIHEEIRATVTAACESSRPEEMSQVFDDGAGDTIYSVDRISEEMLFETEIACRCPILLIAEGLPGGRAVLPRNADETQVAWRFIADAIDGTRSLMYQKRSAWILTGVAPNRGEHTTLTDVEIAV